MISRLLAIIIVIVVVVAEDDGHIDLHDVGPFIEHLAGQRAEELDHDADEMRHDDIGHADDANEHGNHALLADDHHMRDGIADINIADLEGVPHSNAELSHGDEKISDDVDRMGDHVHFEALSFGRKPQNMYNKGKMLKRQPAMIDPIAPVALGRAPGQVNRNSPSGHGGIQKFDPNAPPAPTMNPSFDNFNNAKPQNDGNCLQAINRERAQAGVPELASNQTLVNLAAKHSAYMAASQIASHDGFWSYRFDAVPVGVAGVGEVVVADDMLNTPNGPAKRAVDRWMGGPEHRALLMRGDMFMMGCSTAEGNDGRFYATAIMCSR